MGPFEMVAIIVVAGCIAKVATARYGRPVAPVDDPEVRARAVAQDARIALLEERVKALEAVVSDTQYELKQQFRDLERH